MEQLKDGIPAFSRTMNFIANSASRVMRRKSSTKRINSCQNNNSSVSEGMGVMVEGVEGCVCEGVNVGV